MTGGDPDTVDATAHLTASNDAVADAPVQKPDTDGDIRSALEAEAVEEQHLDERHATTGELYTGGDDFDQVAPASTD